jgi:hypothetical protein
VSSDGVTITSITTDGTVAADVSMGGIRNTGFEVSETTTAFRDGDECAGDGAVSAVVLSFVMNITLPANETSTIGKIETAGSADAPSIEIGDVGGNCESIADAGSISFAQGCQGSGQPVDNNVTWMGQTLSPARGTLALSIISVRHCHDFGCNDTTPGGLKIFVEEAVLLGDEIFAGGQANPAKVNVDGVEDGGVGATTIYADIVSDLPDTGVQGWSLSVAVSVGAIVNVTTDGTAAADHPMGGLRNTGFEVSELTTMSEGGSQCDGLNGAVSAVVLSFVMNITLPPSGSNRVLCLDVEATAEMPGCDLSDPDNPIPGSVSGTIAWKDGCQGAGQPVHNVATVAGNTVAFACCQTVSVCFNGTCAPPVSFALPCDANFDGKVDLADAVAVVNDLFRDGDAALSVDCVAAYDCSQDGVADISDALVIALGLFGGGPLPAAALAGECEEFDAASCGVGACAF